MLMAVSCTCGSTTSIVWKPPLTASSRKEFGNKKTTLLLKSIGTVLDFGKQAAEFTQRVLSKPFTIHTSYAKAPGGSGRYYAFVETRDGHDLGRILIKQGLARIHGVTRSTPYGASSKTMRAQLGDLREYRYVETRWNMARNRPRFVGEITCRSKRQRPQTL